jgi:hypothetical protein
MAVHLKIKFGLVVSLGRFLATSVLDAVCRHGLKIQRLQVVCGIVGVVSLKQVSASTRGEGLVSVLPVGEGVALRRKMLAEVIIVKVVVVRRARRCVGLSVERVQHVHGVGDVLVAVRSC